MRTLIQVCRDLFSSHSHYFGVPHIKDGKLVQVCYECGNVKTITIPLNDRRVKGARI